MSNMGGGTPSHLSPANLLRLNEIIHSRFSFAEDCEITAECNPNDLNNSCASALSDCGVNRISLGVQSLKANKLKLLERDHDAQVVSQAVDIARGFTDSISIDMIFAAPEETPEQWEDDLNAAIELKPDHFSTYELTFEKGTSFWTRREQRKLSQTTEDARCQMYESAIKSLEKNGFQQYEISSFATRGHQSRHNNVYWSGQPYFAFGPGASRFVDGIRETNHQSTTRYINRMEAGIDPTAHRESLDQRELALERLVIGLRRNDGIERSPFVEQTGFDVDDLIGRSVLDQFNEQELIAVTPDNVRLTRRGLMVCDWIAGEILGC